VGRVTAYIGRLWYYFRTGYGIYLTFVLGYGSTLVTVYYLAIKNVPSLLDIFPKFWPFAILATAIGVPLAVGLGWVHMKRSAGYTSEVDIGVESNPYNYKLLPGYWREAFAPLYLELLLQQKKMMQVQGILSEEDKARIEDLEKRLRLLIAGGMAGRPRRG
jgi:hypothetical protein